MTKRTGQTVISDASARRPRRWMVAATIATAALSVALVGLVVPAMASGPRHHPRHHPPHHKKKKYYGDQGAFRLGIGLYTPDGESDLWDSNELNFTKSADDHEDFSIGGEVEYNLNPWSAVNLGLEHFQGAVNQASRDFVDADGFDIVHRSTLEMTPVTIGLTLFPVGRQGALVPYVGAGGGFYWWRYTQAGDFVTFDDQGQPLDIVTTAFQSDGVTSGYYLKAGLDIPAGDNWSLFAEGKWHDAIDDLEDPPPLEIDLSGTNLRAGLSWRF